MADYNVIKMLNDTIKTRADEKSTASYTYQLLSAGDNKIIKKLGEENAEFIRAILVQDDEHIVGEAADYIYHLIVALRYKNIDFNAVLNELEKRHITKTHIEGQ